MRSLLYLIDAVTAICVAVDASRLGARRGALGGGLLDMGPAAWFFACLLVWIVSLPCYLVVRPKLVRRAQVLATHPQFAAAGYGPQPAVAGYATPPGPQQGLAYPALPQPPAPAPGGPPPGYYPDPDPEGQFMRWWDGSNWAPHGT